MSLMRWNPAGRFMLMNEALDRFFDDTFPVPRDGGYLPVPKVDVIENNNDITVKVEMPGFSPENVEAQVEGNALILRGRYNQDNEKTEGQYHLQERRQGSFSRVVPLPSDVDTETARAEFDNGVLTLTLHKRPSSQRKQINITAKNGAGSSAKK
jgi:HSP20 family protein